MKHFPPVLKRLLVFAIIMYMAGKAACRLETRIDRFGNYILEQLDDTPVELCEVNDPAPSPPGFLPQEELDKPVIPGETPPPEYPQRLRLKRVEGKAAVLFKVDSTGQVLDPHIEFATDTSFGRALKDAVLKWKLQPGEKDGNPINSYKRLTMDFALE